MYSLKSSYYFPELPSLNLSKEVRNIMFEEIKNNFTKIIFRRFQHFRINSNSQPISIVTPNYEHYKNTDLLLLIDKYSSVTRIPMVTYYVFNLLTSIATKFNETNG